VQIYNSIICSNTKILTNTIIQRGCIISYNTIIGNDMNLKEYTVISNEDGKKNEEDVGKNGLGVKINYQSEISKKINLLGLTKKEILELDYIDDNDSIESIGSNEEEIPFKVDIQDTVIRAIQNNNTIEDTKLEINSRKFAFDASFIDCNSKF
jgi:hypothetical protein